MSRRLVQQRMTLRDIEWPFHASRAMSVVAELLVSYHANVQKEILLQRTASVFYLHLSAPTASKITQKCGSQTSVKEAG